MAKDSHGERTQPAPPLHVLVAEDDGILQIDMVQTIRSMGYEATIAANGREAVDLLAARHFDLVLMDVRMPVMEGCEAIRVIRGLEGPPKDIPIYVLTGLVSSDEVDRAHDAGADGYLAKPLDRHLLAELIAARGIVCPFAASAQAAVSLEIPAENFEVFNRDPRLSIQLCMDSSEAVRDGEAVLRDALARGDWNHAADWAHTLAGVAGIMGMKQLKEACLAMEAGFRKGAGGMDHAALDSLQDDFHAAIGPGLTYLDALKASLEKRLE